MSDSAERMRKKRERDKALEAAKMIGRAYGEDEAARLGETGEKRERRIRRAERYALGESEGRFGAGYVPGREGTGPSYISPGKLRLLLETASDEEIAAYDERQDIQDGTV